MSKQFCDGVMKFKGTRRSFFENFYILFLLSQKRMKASTEIVYFAFAIYRKLAESVSFCVRKVGFPQT